MADPALVALAALAPALIVDAIVQLLLARRRWIPSFVAGFGAGLLTFLVIVVLTTDRTTPLTAIIDATATGVLAFGTMAFFHFNIVNGARAALRLRLMEELSESPNGMTREEILARYRPEDMFRARIARLVGHGQVLRDEEGRLTVRPGAMLFITRAVFATKRIFAVGRRGVDGDDNR